MDVNVILEGDALTRLKELPDNSIDCVITSPPYWALRDYKVDGQLGQEPTFTEFINKLIEIFDEIRRVLKPTGTVFVNLGDTYNGSGGAGGDYNAGGLKDGQPKFQGSRKQWKQHTMKHLKDDPTAHRRNPNKSEGLQTKSLLGVPDRFKIAMIDRGWICRNEIIWYKRNCMPSSAKDRFTVDFEKIFFFTKSKRYYFETQYRPYSEATLGELEKAYNGQGRKDYEGNGVQNPSDVKSRIVNTGIKFGGNKAEGYGNPTYSEKEWTIRIPTRPGNDTGNGKSGTIDEPNAGLHNSELSTKREQIVRIIDGQPFGSRMRCVWDITTKGFPDAHFATFPEDLVETPIKAGCPEYVCNKCGVPRFPIVEPSEEYAKYLGKSWHDHGNDETMGQHQGINYAERVHAEYRKVGLSDCGCGAGFEAGVVLDPFMGAGTVALVALKHARRFIGIELNPTYTEMANKRLKPYLEQSKLF